MLSWRLAIVGSRRRARLQDCSYVKEYLLHMREARPGLVVVSGGCRTGADNFAKVLSHQLDIVYVEHAAIILPTMTHLQKVQEYYRRNHVIARDSDAMLALVADDRRGGTEHAIRCMLGLRKPVTLCLGDGSFRDVDS